ncbi:hypothetical protein ACLOJK_032069 [Asimina triloba]
MIQRMRVEESSAICIRRQKDTLHCRAAASTAEGARARKREPPLHRLFLFGAGMVNGEASKTLSSFDELCCCGPYPSLFPTFPFSPLLFMH